MSAAVEIIRSTFGGGWACPLTDDGEASLRAFFGEEPEELRPLCDRIGYVIEPWQAGDLAEHLQARGTTWERG